MSKSSSLFVRLRRDLLQRDLFVPLNAPEVRAILQVLPASIDLLVPLPY
jgi:hypothetical protein